MLTLIHTPNKTKKKEKEKRNDTNLEGENMMR